MKLASAVVSVSGQRLLPPGAMLDQEKIDFLSKNGIRYIQIHEKSYEESIDAAVFADVLKNMGAPPPPDTVVPPPAPAQKPPEAPAGSAAPAPKVDKAEHVKKIVLERRDRLADQKKKLAEKHGEKYTTVSYTLGDPKPLPVAGSDAPFVDLLGLLARDLTDRLIFERQVDQETMQLLTQDVIAELSGRQNVMNLLTGAYSVSRYLLSHMVNVSLYSMRVASEMGLSSVEVTDVAVGAMLHDIGMVLVPIGLWTSRRELSTDARSQVEKHCDLGAALIRETPNAREEWATPALEHHERLNGSGYPSGKSGKQIALSSKIVQICDVYEAMTSDRSYRYARFPDISMKHILGGPDQFDRDVAQVFCKCLGFYPEGYNVKLSTGEHAVVISSNPKNVFRPVIKLVTDPAGTALVPDAQLELDLTHRLDLRVIEISNRRFAPTA